MKSLNLSKELQRINDLVTKTNEACSTNLEMQSHWAKYICILSAGFLENALKDTYTGYATKQVSQPVAKFVASKLSSIKNPKTERFLEIAGAFKEDWVTELSSYVQQNGRQEAIDSIMNNRHLIAHGKMQNSNISLVQIKAYLAKAVEVIDFIEQQCEH
jgi:RiboL-PSP-HEPN